MYKVIFEKQALKDISKLDKFQARVITKWVRKHLEDTENPRLHGKPLGNNLSGIWSYRVGKYRSLAEIIDDKVIINVIRVRHRKDAYD